METFLASFILVAASEMGDKTQLLAFSLAARFRRPWPVIAGILLATLANHFMAASAGRKLSQFVTERTLATLLALAFIGFGVWTLQPDNDEDATGMAGYGPFFTTVVLFFLAEMGDKTQLATAALGAKFTSVSWVTLGTTAGMIAADAPAVLLGHRFADRISLPWMRRLAAGLFFIFGILSAVTVIWGRGWRLG